MKMLNSFPVVTAARMILSLANPAHADVDNGYDSVRFCRRLSGTRPDGPACRLLAEAEWEYVSRAASDDDSALPH